MTDIVEGYKGEVEVDHIWVKVDTHTQGEEEIDAVHSL